MSELSLLGLIAKTETARYEPLKLPHSRFPNHNPFYSPNPDKFGLRKAVGLLARIHPGSSRFIAANALGASSILEANNMISDLTPSEAKVGPGLN